MIRHDKKKKQIKGQIDIFGYIKERQHASNSCEKCICEKCLYRWSSRCPYGGCYDKIRAVEEPYDRAHPNEAPRTAWSNWDQPGEQAHWCRGGSFYPAFYCEKFVKYTGCSVEECMDCPIQVFQDGYIICALKHAIGCAACIDRYEGRNVEKAYECHFMTDSGCEHMSAIKNQILDAVAMGENIELCKEQCCIGCTRRCSYRCSKGAT